MALLYYEQGRYKEAEKSHKKALSLQRKTLGEEHPNVATTYNSLGVVYFKQGRYEEALKKSLEAIAVEERIMRRMFAFSSERDRLNYVSLIKPTFYMYLSFVLEKFSHEADHVKTALDVVLKRKSLTASALAAQNEALTSGRYPHLQKKYQQFRNLTESYINLVSGEVTQNKSQQIKKVIQQLDNLQTEISQEIPEIQLQEQEIDWQILAQLLPEGSVYIDIIYLYVFDFENQQSCDSRYVAFIVSPEQTDIVKMVDLGKASILHERVQAFRSSLLANAQEIFLKRYDLNLSKINQQKGANDKSLRLNIFQYDTIEGQKLRQLLLDPFIEYLDSKQLFISPDGIFNLIPFELLPLGNNKGFLLDDYQINYLSGGRDLFRYQLKTNRSVGSPLILADPEFDLSLSEVFHFGTLAVFRGAETLALWLFLVMLFLKWDVLDLILKAQGIHPLKRAEGTEILAKTVAQQLDVKPYLRENALETYLTQPNLNQTKKTKKCPSILLIATHGMFLEAIKQKGLLPITILALSRDNKTLGLLLLLLNFTPLFNRFQNIIQNVNDPMLCSGVALAGANNWLKGEPFSQSKGKGFLFALDIAALDLWANELTVLCACQTGVGDIVEGEGVFGLRRAFMVAGSKAVVMSLWSVPSYASALLMERFFIYLKQGLEVRNALQKAQNDIRTITVAELRQSELGLNALKDLVRDKDEETQKALKNFGRETPLDCQKSDTPLAHPYFWGAWICQGKTQSIF